MSSQKTKRAEAESWDLPEIPDKVYFTIGEVGRLCNLKPHVLRYWEQEFNALSPVKRRGNRRYYQHKDLELIVMIKDLLYRQGYTIEGARQRLTTQKKAAAVSAVTTPEKQTMLKSAVKDLENLLGELSDK
jgi:DNA-binding transcriptional MerR regulator